MQESIELKSNKYVLTLVMDPDVPFERILSDVSDKFRRSARFFRNGQMALEFSGRELEEGQKRKVIDALEPTAARASGSTYLPTMIVSTML